MATSAPPRGWAIYVLLFWVGLLIFAGIGFVGYFAGSTLSGGSGPGQIVAAGVLVLITLVPAVLLLRRGQIALGSGLLAGYALAALGSGGQCTFLAPDANYGVLTGMAVYIYALGGTLLLALVVAVVDAFRRR